VAASGRSAIFEAQPAGGTGKDYIARNLLVFKDDGDPSRFMWPPDNGGRPTLLPGGSVLGFKVLRVGKTLAGEQVVLRVDPPLSLKAHMPGYGFLWWFFFWPFYGALLLAWFACLLWQSKRVLSSAP